MECAGELVLTSEVEWKGGELLKQVRVGQGRVDSLRSVLGDVAEQVSRIKDNQELVLKQRRLLEGQQDAIFDVKQLAQRAQSDNEAMRVEHAQLRKLKDQAASQLAENASAEARHRKQLDQQAALVSGVRQDLMALSAENAQLRRACADQKTLAEQHEQVQGQLAEAERAHKGEVLALRRERDEQAQQHEAALAQEADRHKKLLKEQRFKLLRAQQERQQMDADTDTKEARINELKEKGEATALKLKETAVELKQLRAAHAQLQEMFKTAEGAAKAPAASAAGTGAGGDTAAGERSETAKELLLRVEELEAAAALQHLEHRKSEAASAESVRAAQARADAAAAETARHRSHATESGERADALAAKLAMAEASLSAKDELLKTRTERLRVLTTAQEKGGPVPPPSTSSAPAPAPAPASGEEVAELRGELGVLRQRYSQLEQTAKTQLEKAFADRNRLEAKVTELTASIDHLTD